MKNKIKVLIADDHSVVRMGLVALFDSKADIQVVGEARDGEEAVRAAEACKPDVIIMDLMMPKLNGAEATKAIRERCPGAKVLILTTFGTSDDISRALSVGASGAILKSADNAELVEAVRTVAAGESAVSRDISRLIREDPPVQELSPRQQEILGSVTRGLTNREIAKVFDISPESVKSHITTIFAKIGAKTRSEAVTIALRKQLLKM